jgi:hypothetical protein
MKPLVYLLIFLMIWAQGDDAWAVALDLSSAPLVEDDDEYLPLQRRLQEEESSPSQNPVFVGLRPHTAGSSHVRRGMPSEWNLTTPFTAPPLYVFMSLQI